MFTTLGFEAQKAVTQERLRQAALRRQLPRSFGSRVSAFPTLGLGRGRWPLHAAAALLGLLAAIGGVLAAASSALALPSNCHQAPPTNVECIFRYTGSEQTFSVPSGVDSVYVSALGATGGSGGPSAPGGAGALATAVVPVRPGQLLYVEVGGTGPSLAGSAGPGGWNGGGGASAFGGGGGGASDVRTVSCGSGCPGDFASLASRLVVAAGGGGGGIGAAPGFGGAADNAGGNAQGSGGSGGAAGTPSSGGAGGAPGSDAVSSTVGGAGSGGALGQGGAGAASLAGHLIPFGGGGGGGGGYQGGGGGGSGPNTGGFDLTTSGGPSGSSPSGGGGGGGGGGSSYAPDGTTLTYVAGAPADVAILYGVMASASPQALGFAPQPEGTLTASQPVTVTNTDAGSLHVTGLAFSGADAGDFLVSSDDCRGNTLAPGSACTVNVSFAPHGQGSRTATLQIASNDPLTPATVALSGTGSPPATGLQGPAGSPGPQGATGPQGPAGPAGTVVCNNTAVAQILCSIILKPGTWSTHSTVSDVTFRISRQGRTITTGKGTVRYGRVTVRSRRLRAGRYLLTITLRRRSHQRTLMTRALTITAAGRVTTNAQPGRA